MFRLMFTTKQIKPFSFPSFVFVFFFVFHVTQYSNIISLMALELGLRVTRTRDSDNATSVSELRISKNTAGPVFVSTETHSSFILTCYLKGYDRNSFQIKISEDGKEISISGEKPVQEMLMMGRVMLKKNVEIVGFRKVFKIPNGVVLDRIKAKFDEDESFLKIVMPKLVKGMCGVQIEEMKNEGFGESSQKASETGENESVCRKKEGLSDKKLLESTNGDVTADTIQKEIEAMKKSVDHIPKNIEGGSPEVSKEPVEESENIMPGRPPGTTREEKSEEIGEAKFENGGKDEERVQTEMSKKGFEATERSKDKAAEIERGEIEVPKSGTEDRGEQKVKDIHEGAQKKVAEETKCECVGKDEEERVEAKIRKEGLEAAGEGILERTQKKENEETKFGSEGKDEERVGIDTRMERMESEKELARPTGDDEKSRIDEKEAKLKTEGKERKGRETTKEEPEAIETRVHDGKIEVSTVKGKKQKEIEDTDKDKVEEVFNGTQEKEIGKIELAIEAKDTTIEGGVSEKLHSGATGASVKDIVEGTNKGEIDAPKFEDESRDEEMLKEESPVQEPKLPTQLEESEGTFGGIERGEDKSEGAKLKAIEEPKVQSVQENIKIQKCATSKGENLEETEEAAEAIAKRQSQEAEGISEKVEGEEPKKMSNEESKAKGNDYARDSGKKDIEESAIRSSRDGQHVENIVSKVFEELGADTAKFSKQMSETKAQREKEVKVKEEIIVKRETEVKVKEVVIVNKYEEAKEGFEKATTGDRIQLETGESSDGRRGFDEETLEAAKWDEIKAVKEGSLETEPSLEKVKGESNDNVQGAVFSPFMKDNERETTERAQKENEDPKVGTKIAESMDEREGPKDTKTEEMEEVKRKIEETHVVADEESKIEEKIRGAEIERIVKTNQFEKDLQEVPKAKDRKALGKGMCERESMLSTQQPEVREIDKVCEECKTTEANLEREKWRTTQSVEDEKLRREDTVKQVEESMQKEPEKEHPGKSEVENEVKHVEAKVAYPEHRKEVETKNEVEGSRLKELPPPKVQSLEPLESEKKNMKWKPPKTKKLVPVAREGEEYEAGKPPEVESSSSTQGSMVNEEESEIDLPKSDASRIPSEEKEIEALQPNVLSDQNLEGQEHFKTSTEDRGHYFVEKEKRLETKKVAEEEKLNQKDEEEILSCKRERTKIAECKDKNSKMKKNGSEKINQIKGVAEEFRDVLVDNEKEESQEVLLPQTAEIQGKEKISEIREVQQEKRKEIPFHANKESEAVISNREVESQKPIAAHPKESSIDFSGDKPKGEVDKLQRKNLLSPSVEKLSKGSPKTSRPGVEEDAPTVENFPQFQEGRESTSSLEGTKASETAVNELDKPPAEKLEVAEEGKIDECRDGGHLEVQEPEKQESELDFQESTRRRSDQEVERKHFSQQEENHEGHALEEGKADEAENVVQVEISQESEDLEDIKVEAREKKVELHAPLIFAGSVFIASLIILFFGHKRAGKR